MKKVVIFDFDGVIMDSWEHAYARNVRNWPDLQPQEHKNFFNGNIHMEIAKMPPSVVSDEEQQKWLEEEWYPKKVDLPLFQGIEDVLRKLSEKYILVINTSETAVSVHEYLSKNELDKFFDKVYGLEISKDKVQKFHQILKDYDITPENCIFITDTVGDVLEAEQCGIPSVAVTYGYQDRSFFNSVEDKVVGFADTPEQILNFIN